MIKCEGCFYFDICSSRKLCSDYLSLDSYTQYFSEQESIEQNRAIFREEWEKYILGFED